MTPDEELAAREERVNEAGLEAEDVYWWIHDAPKEEAIDYLRALLRMRREVTEVLDHTLNRESEILP
jgi:hypothetical protein